MVSKVFSSSFSGLDCHIIEVQADVSNGMSVFSIVGMGDASVQESKERVRSSIKNSGAVFPVTRKTINLAPAQLRKHGSSFDLPIAISILLASQQIPAEKFQNSLIIGELSLTGKIKRINGALPITQHAKEMGFTKIFLPKQNALEAGFIDGIDIYPIDNLSQLINFATGKFYIVAQKSKNIRTKSIRSSHVLSSIIGHEKAKRALTIAAAGGHNILFQGSPGCGKTLLCRAFRSLLPPMSKKEIFESTKIYSISGLLNEDTPLITERPFREVHHTASKTSIIGGGNQIKPGEITLAHNGVLFFDEIAEFEKSTLETLRQPLEDKFININRAKSFFKFPSNFIFLATMNPCPCGYKNDRKIPCICTESQIKNYRKRISGPLFDRFDIFLTISKVSMGKIFHTSQDQQSAKIMQLINEAGNLQNRRFKDSSISKNGHMNLGHIKKHCRLNPESQSILEQADRRINLSNRGYLKTLKLARTIADLARAEKIEPRHIAEAIQYRQVYN